MKEAASNTTRERIGDVLAYTLVPYFAGALVASAVSALWYREISIIVLIATVALFPIHLGGSALIAALTPARLWRSHEPVLLAAFAIEFLVVAGALAAAGWGSPSNTSLFMIACIMCGAASLLVHLGFDGRKA